MNKKSKIGKCLIFVLLAFFIGASVAPSIIGNAKETLTALDDLIPPTVEIIKPHYNMLYLLNKAVLQIGYAPIIISLIDIEVNATDDNESGVEKVEFYIDGVLKSTDTEEPFAWRWSEIVFFQHEINVTAYDFAGNNATESLFCWKFF